MTHPLTQFRNELDLSRAALAMEVGTSRQTIHRIESGAQTPSLDLVGRFCALARKRGKNLSANDFIRMEAAE